VVSTCAAGSVDEFVEWGALVLSSGAVVGKEPNGSVSGAVCS